MTNNVPLAIPGSGPNFDISDISSITNQTSIKIQADFSTIAGTTSTLTSWAVTVTEPASGDPPADVGKFYGYPSPLIIESRESCMTFKYSTESSSELQGAPITQPGKVTLTILDLNNNLVKTVCDNKQYPLSGFNSSYFEEKWDGKNGNGVAVMSGSYIAKLEIKYDDGTKSNIPTFVFAIIR